MAGLMQRTSLLVEGPASAVDATFAITLVDVPGDDGRTGRACRIPLLSLARPRARSWRSEE